MRAGSSSGRENLFLVWPIIQEKLEVHILDWKGIQILRKQWTSAFCRPNQIGLQAVGVRPLVIA